MSSKVINKFRNEIVDVSYLGILKNMVRNVFMKDNLKIQWGRFSRTYCPVKQEIKSNNANRDHCGDVICGSQMELKRIFGEKKNEKKLPYVS